MRDRALPGGAMSGGGHHHPGLRATLAIVAAADLVSFYVFLAAARAEAQAQGLAIAGLSDLLSRPPLTALIVLLGSAAAYRFARAPGRLAAGVATLLALALLSGVHAQLYGSPWRHLFFSGVCLGGWLLGLAVSRRRGTPDDESYARVGAIALLGAAYGSSAISKLVFGGPSWLSGHPIQVIVVGQDGLVSDGLLSYYRWFAASTPAVAAFFALATVAFEGSGPLMLVGPRLRRLVAAGLLSMHGNIYLLTDILYWESMVLLVAFGLLSREPAAVEDGWRGASVPFGRRYVAAVALCVVVAGLGVAHQARRFTAAHDAAAPPRAVAAAPAAPPAT
ncbi:MAG: hypothetical protein SF182_14375, partial [Deltaproteobacteria bacterium]|nr:hypothetical protein [Deltaproteobacteria bacterium]